MQKRDRKPLHPIAAEAALSLVREDGVLFMPIEQLAAFKGRLIGDEELEWAARSLVIAASRLAESGAARAADDLVEIACSASPALWQQVSIGANERHNAQG